MRSIRARLFFPFALLSLASAAASAQSGAAPSREILPKASLHQAYYFQLSPPARGTPPWHWRVLRGALPPGISLDKGGTLAGAPTAPGEFRFTLETRDSAPKPLLRSQDYILTVPPPLTAVWTQPPQVTPEGAIAGELEVTNGSGRIVDLTVIVVAVNTSNKAFALGYQHVSLDPGALRVAFASAVPRDSYVVHADAVAEIAETSEIYRARLQTNPLAVP